jgi:4-amino-4-deoxy-L-arabinose transferase-like glycosyltransferase
MDLRKGIFLWATDTDYGILRIMLSKKNLLTLLPLLLIVLLASVLRLWHLGQVPISMSDDEIRISYTAYSLAHTGKDVFGNFLPAVFRLDGASASAQLPFYLSALFFLVLPLTAFAARLPFALASIGSVILLYAVVKKLFNNHLIALFSAFVLSVSVWSLQLSRFVIEINIAVFFYILAIALFIYFPRKTKFFLLSMLFFFLASYAYAGTKIVVIPILFVLVWYKFKELGKKHLLLILLTLVLALGSFAYLSVTQGAAKYMSAGGVPFFFLDKQQTAISVELQRRASNEPQLIKTLYHNKFSYWTKTFAANYLTAFSPQYLFLDQEASGIYSIWGRGEQYLFELPLLLVGLFYLFWKKRKEAFLILGLLLIAPLPSALGAGSATWTARSGLMPLWLSVFVGAGIYFLVTFFKKRPYQYLVLAIIALIYVYSVGGYISQYYYDWSQTNAKYFSKSTQDLVHLVNKYQKQGKDVIVSGATQNTFLHYAFYNRLDPRLVQVNISKTPIKFANFTFQYGCLPEIPQQLTYIALVDCKYKQKPTSQIKAYDSSETVWNIYEK